MYIVFVYVVDKKENGVKNSGQYTADHAETNGEVIVEEDGKSFVSDNLSLAMQLEPEEDPIDSSELPDVNVES